MSPLLWNITFDSVLRMPTRANCDIVCYADDTLIIAGSRNMNDVINRINIIINAIARKINWMGLQMAAEKQRRSDLEEGGKREQKKIVQ